MVQCFSVIKLDFSFVRCPCNSLLWQRHLNLCIYNNNNNNKQTKGHWAEDQVSMTLVLDDVHEINLTFQ